MKRKWVGSWLGLFSSLWLLACGGSKPADSPGGKAELGRTPEAPVVTCGPKDSYEYVATRFRCPDGSNPLHGDLELARKTRRGSMNAPHGDHLLDLYEVPCTGGTAKVYVDMYGCPEYAAGLAEARGTPEGDALMASYKQGDWEKVVEHCKNLGPDAKGDERAWCMALVPASLYALKRDGEGLSALTEVCTRMPPAGPDSDARAAQIALLFTALASLAGDGKFESTEDQRAAMVESWLKGCQVPPAQLQAVLEAMQKGH